MTTFTDLQPESTRQYPCSTTHRASVRSRARGLPTRRLVNSLINLAGQNNSPIISRIFPNLSTKVGTKNGRKNAIHATNSLRWKILQVSRCFQRRYGKLRVGRGGRVPVIFLVTKPLSSKASHLNLNHRHIPIAGKKSRLLSKSAKNKLDQRFLRFRASSAVALCTRAP